MRLPGVRPDADEVPDPPEERQPLDVGWGSVPRDVVSEGCFVGRSALENAELASWVLEPPYPCPLFGLVPWLDGRRRESVRIGEPRDASQAALGREDETWLGHRLTLFADC